MNAKILVLGATGTVGGETARALVRQNVAFAVGVREPERARQTLSDLSLSHVELRRFDFADATTFGAFAEVERVFLLRPPSVVNIERDVFPIIQAMKSAGVRHVVFLSLLGADKARWMPHAKIEKLLIESGMKWTFLRASYFLQNFSTTHRDDIKLRDEIFVPAGRGKTSFIDALDIGEVAALCLTHSEHENRAYDLTGELALNYYELARDFSEVLGRRIVYQSPSVFGFWRALRKRHIAAPFVLVMIGIYTTARWGMASRVAPDVRRLLGRAATTPRQFIERNRALWENRS